RGIACHRRAEGAGRRSGRFERDRCPRKRAGRASLTARRFCRGRAGASGSLSRLHSRRRLGPVDKATRRLRRKRAMMSMESAESQFDLAVIGAGPGGYVAAIRAAQLGLKTAIVEREHLGGICLNWGCIPTKALLRTAELYHQMGRAAEFGLAADNVRFDLPHVVERSRKVAERLNNGVSGLLKKNKVAVIWGEARLERPREVTVGKP